MRIDPIAIAGGPAALPLSAAAVRAALDAVLPPVDRHGEIVEHVSDGAIRLRLPVRPELTSETRLGGHAVRLMSGPMMLALADTTMFACALATFGAKTVAMIQTMTVNFLSPAGDTDLVCDARIIRRGGRSLYFDCAITAADSPSLLCHITATYALRTL